MNNLKITRINKIKIENIELSNYIISLIGFYIFLASDIHVS